MSDNESDWVDPLLEGDDSWDGPFVIKVLIYLIVSLRGLPNRPLSDRRVLLSWLPLWGSIVIFFAFLINRVIDSLCDFIEGPVFFWVSHALFVLGVGAHVVALWRVSRDVRRQNAPPQAAQLFPVWLNALMGFALFFLPIIGLFLLLLPAIDALPYFEASVSTATYRREVSAAVGYVVIATIINGICVWFLRTKRTPASFRWVSWILFMRVMGLGTFACVLAYYGAERIELGTPLISTSVFFRAESIEEVDSFAAFFNVWVVLSAFGWSITLLCFCASRQGEKRPLRFQGEPAMQATSALTTAPREERAKGGVEKHNKTLYGIRGWLLFLVIVMMFYGPFEFNTLVWHAFAPPPDFSLLPPQYRAIVYFVSTSKVLAFRDWFFCIASSITLYRLLFVRNWRTIQIQIWTMVVAFCIFIYSIVILPFDQFGISTLPAYGIRICTILVIGVKLGGMIWYLKRSVRVRNTYPVFTESVRD